MLSYILRRIVYMVPTLILISILSFAVIVAPPGDLLTTQMLSLHERYGPQAERQIEVLRTRYGLDRPAHVQYYRWMRRIILHQDFGQSFAQNRPVKEIIVERLPHTILLTVLTVFFQWIISVPIAIYSAVRQHTVFDYLFTFIAFVGRSIPNFLLALVLMYFVYSRFGWSLGGLHSVQFQDAPWSWAKAVDLARHLIVPVIVIGTAGMAGLVRVLRGTMLDELDKEYVQTARAKGLPEWRIVLTYPTKVAILPVISTIGWILPAIISGEVITAIVLNLPTTGAALYTALRNQDMYVAGSFILILSTLTLIGTLLSDILLAKFDPRIRYE